MLRSILALPLIALAAAPAAASSYSATLETPMTARFVARDIVWSCVSAVCQGATEESRPVVLCQSLAKRAGRIDSFLVDGRSVSAAELEQCNTAAKAQPAKALAAQ